MSQSVAEQLGVLEAELRTLKLGALSKRATVTEGIDEDAVEAALDDDDDPKAALIALLLAHAGGALRGSEPEPTPAPVAPQVSADPTGARRWQQPARAAGPALFGSRCHCLALRWCLDNSLSGSQCLLK